MHRDSSWIELDAAALRHNIGLFRSMAGKRGLMVVVKADAYGHGAIPAARIAIEAGADWLAVFAPWEAFALRDAGIKTPLLILGPTPADDLARAAAEEIRVTVADPSAIRRVVESDCNGLRVHLKLESGTHRQGLVPRDFESLTALLDNSVVIEGAYTHFADIEDTTDHSYAMAQLEAFTERTLELAAAGIRPTHLHTACTAATLLFESTYFDLVRVGIGAYGLWPSKETLVSVKSSGRTPVELRPVMRWKTHIAQLQEVGAGASVGYGRTYKTSRPALLAILPVGYANGYDRHLSNLGHVLVRGQRAPIRGRVMMNMTVVDVTDVAASSGDQPEVGDEVVLLGRQGGEQITAEMMAGWIDTINYEVVTRAEPGRKRVVVEG